MPSKHGDSSKGRLATSSHDAALGYVYLVGAGPGDPGMITLRGIECLRQADVVLYDYLVNPALLEHVRPGTETICLGSHSERKVWPQSAINAEIVRHAREGRCVVRLKGGDPAVFARGAEEAETLAEADIPFEIVPGITAALAAGSCAGIPITHRELASAVALVTGHERAGQDGSKLDFRALAQFPGTLVFYMGTTTVRRWSSELIAGGLPPETPVAAIRRCSFPDQTRFQCRLDEIADRVETPPKLRPPVIFIVGAVTQLAPKLNWFEQRPLFGQTVWITRPAHQIPATAVIYARAGANTVAIPAIEIQPAETQSLDATLDRLDEFNWIVFSSANGVSFFCDRLLATHRDMRCLAGVKLAAIGPGTAEKLADYHLRADFIPSRFDADAMAAALAEVAEGQRFLLIRASRGREVLHEKLTAAGGDVEQLVVYQSLDVTHVDEAARTQLARGEVDWVTVTSSAIARSLAKLFGEDLKKAHLASISPITSQTLRDLGFEPTIESVTATMQGLFEAVVAHTEQ